MAALSQYEWEIIVSKRCVGFPNFYWQAHSFDTMIRFENGGPFSSEKSAKENFRNFAKVENIKKYKFI